MSDHITPTQAEDFLGGYEEREDGAYYLPESIGKAALSMIARAHYEYAIARRTDAGEVEYEKQFFEWSADPDCANWTRNREGLEILDEDGEFIARRLVIDLGEAEE